MESHSGPAARLSHVHVRYGEARILDDISLSIAPGRVTAIVGESGSGKSTLLRLLNGLVRPASGDVEVFGSSLGSSDMIRVRRRIGYAVQDVGLFPHLTVTENVLLPVEIAEGDIRTGRGRAEHLMSVMGLDPGLGDRFPHELSGGQQQRIGICRAMIRRPPLLLLDESFSGVDALTRAEIHERFLRLQADEGIAVVLVTHDVREAATLGRQIVVLRSGKIEAVGDSATLLARPAGDYARRLLEPLSR